MLISNITRIGQKDWVLDRMPLFRDHERVIRITIFFAGILIGAAGLALYFGVVTKSLLTREFSLGQIHVGMKGSEISEALLSGSKPIRVIGPEIIVKCGDGAKGLIIQGNPSWVVGRFEDLMEVYFTSDDTICAVSRLGL